MSIVLKRPMFRKGGEATTHMSSGITHIKPRKGYAKGDLVSDTDTDPDYIAANINPNDSAGLENLAISDVMANKGSSDEDLYLSNADADTMDEYITKALLQDQSLQSEPNLKNVETTGQPVTPLSDNAALIRTPMQNIKQKLLGKQDR
jgi:hypothetical protein